MRFSRGFASFFLPVLFLLNASAEIKIKVVDPHDAAVVGAQVELLRVGKPSPAEVLNTSGEGSAIFHEAASSVYRVRVLAPGFAVETVDLSAGREAVTVQMRLATAAETVVVTATRTPVPGEAAGADVDTLSGGQLQVMGPVAANDTMRFLPGAVVNTAGQRGGLASLFVRGGESRYNKVIVDGVTINEPGGTFDFGNFPLAQADRLEFVRGAQSTLYGSDAMTSVVQVWTRSGSTRIPELRFGADGGNFETASGYASLGGAYRRFDYNFFGDQFNTGGQGVNNAYSDSLEGANVGAALSDRVGLRVRVRHSNSHTGIPGEWNFNGDGFVAPIPVGDAHLNNLLGSVELAIAGPSGWQHRITAFDYLYRYNDFSPGGNKYNYPSHEADHINRVGFEYQGDYSERTWAHTTMGYRVENENGSVGNVDYGLTPGQRLDSDLYLQQQVNVGRLTAIAGGRFVHNSAFGNTGVPRVALTLLARRGGEIFSGTRLRFSYATGFKEPRLEETFNGIPPNPYNLPNTGLKPERVRAFEAGVQQQFLGGKYVLNATYFNNLFHDQINYVIENLPPNFPGQYVNVNKAFAHGAEIGLQAKFGRRILGSATYTYTSSEYLDNPDPFDVVFNPGMPLLRRPKHSGNVLVSYLGKRWGSNLSGSFVGRRSDSDFVDQLVDHAAGYARVDVGGWYAINSRITAYANVENALDHQYNEVVGYPALPANVRAGVRFRIGGE
jgi:vitamin B12 transporter